MMYLKPYNWIFNAQDQILIFGHNDNNDDIYLEINKNKEYKDIHDFFVYKKIKPYDWLKLKNYRPIPGKKTKCCLNLRTEDYNLEHIKKKININIKYKYLFFKIETKGSYIKNINIIQNQNNDQVKKIILTTDPLLNDQKNSINIIKYKSDEKIRKMFISICNLYSPNYIIGNYNEYVDIKKYSTNNFLTKFIDNKSTNFYKSGIQFIFLDKINSYKINKPNNITNNNEDFFDKKNYYIKQNFYQNIINACNRQKITICRFFKYDGIG